MTWQSYGPYLLIAVLLVLSPGPDTLVLLRNALAGGRRGGMLAAAGILAGNLAQGTAAALGLGVLVAQSHTLFGVLRWSARPTSWCSACRPCAGPGAATGPRPWSPSGGAVAVRAGSGRGSCRT